MLAGPREIKRGPLNGAKDAITAPTRTQNFALDALGNWDSLTTDGGSPQTRAHNKQNQITSISGQTSPLHDNNGSMTRDQTGRTLTYDGWNRLKSVVTVSNPPTYYYDALGRRIRESIPDGGGGGGQSFTLGGDDDGGGSTIDTDFYYSDKWQVIEERVANILTAQYIWSERYVDAMVMRHRNFTGTGGAPLERFYVQTDVNFNVTALFNATSQPPAVVERYVYDPYGQRTAKTPTWGPRMVNGIYSFKNGFQGKRYDSNTGLYHFNFRDYSPSLGRFMQVDPIGYLDGMNRQQFVGSNPVNWVDPLGLKRAEMGPGMLPDAAIDGGGSFAPPQTYVPSSGGTGADDVAKSLRDLLDLIELGLAKLEEIAVDSESTLRAVMAGLLTGAVRAAIPGSAPEVVASVAGGPVGKGLARVGGVALKGIAKAVKRFSKLALKKQTHEYNNLLRTYREHLKKYGQLPGHTSGEVERIERQVEEYKKMLQERGIEFDPEGNIRP